MLRYWALAARMSTRVSKAVIEHIKSCEKCRTLFNALADEMDRHAYGFEHRN
jgi:predicted anti-sigma-YlaC factor YlaD